PRRLGSRVAPACTEEGPRPRRSPGTHRQGAEGPRLRPAPAAGQAGEVRRHMASEPTGVPGPRRGWREGGGPWVSAGRIRAAPRPVTRAVRAPFSTTPTAKGAAATESLTAGGYQVTALC